MALNCNTCGNKQNAVSQGHCTEFQHVPEIDECAMHTGSVVAKAVAAKPQGEYLWLRQAHSSTDEVKPIPSTNA